MKKTHLGFAVATVLLAGCAGFTGQNYINDLNAADLSGNSFTQDLAREYRDVANYEWAEMMDYRDGEHFARKGLAAAAGDEVLPDEVSGRTLPEFAVADITDASKRLNDALASGARTSSPEMAAKAQAKFDCWMEQQEENHQPDDIAACRKDFEAAMSQLGPAKYMVFFDFGSARLTPAAAGIVHQAAVDAKAHDMTKFEVVGHTDTVGGNGANKALSMARAAAVRAALRHEGVPARNIHVVGEGESHLLVQTADGVKEASNRRVEIMLK